MWCLAFLSKYCDYAMVSGGFLGASLDASDASTGVLQCVVGAMVTTWFAAATCQDVAKGVPQASMRTHASHIISLTPSSVRRSDLEFSSSGQTLVWHHYIVERWDSLTNDDLLSHTQCYI